MHNHTKLSQPLPNDGDVTIHLIPPLGLPSRTFASMSNNTEGACKPESRASSGDSIDNPPHLALSLRLCFRKSKVTIQRSFLTTLLACCGHSPAHPGRPATNEVPYTGSHKEEIEGIPENRTPSEAMSNISKSYTRASSFNDQWRGTVDPYVESNQRCDKVSSTCL